MPVIGEERSALCVDESVKLGLADRDARYLDPAASIALGGSRPRPRSSCAGSGASNLGRGDTIGTPDARIQRRGQDRHDSSSAVIGASLRVTVIVYTNSGFRTPLRCEP